MLKSCLEDKWNVDVKIENSVIPWLVEFAAYLLNRFEVGTDGKTAYERSKGKKARSPGIQFGEGILWEKRATRGALGKMTIQWRDGVFLGVKGRTGEIVVGDESGV